MLPITELGGRYHLEELIAAGGMGEVWRAVDQVLGRPVAVKLLRPEYLHDELTLLRFRGEAQHAGLLNHPGIAQVYDYQDETPEEPAYLVMELVNGPSLAGLLAGGPLEPWRTAEVLAQAADALDAAHAAGVLHRDIKPSNLLLTREGRVKVTDFGIAQSSRTGHITQTGMLIGTVAYLAPERVAGSPATVASDLYALGMVGYECLAGQPPFRGEPLQVALAHRLEDLPDLPPSSLSQPGGPELAALIADLAAKDPAARPASAAVVAERAGSISDGQAFPGDRQAFPGDRQAFPGDRQAFPGDSRTGPGDSRTASTDGLAVPAGAPRRRRLALAGVAAGVVALGLLGWLAVGQGSTAQPHPAQSRAARAVSTPSAMRQAASPARSGVPARAAATGPALTSSTKPSAPAPTRRASGSPAPTTLAPTSPAPSSPAPSSPAPTSPGPTAPASSAPAPTPTGTTAAGKQFSPAA